MFFSLDLLSIRGGKMNTIWLLGTVKEKEAIIKKKKAELLKNDLKAICADLVSRFPVQGKDRSLSLRMSSNLAYGVCVNLRVQAADLAGAALRLLSIKSVPRDQCIDLPAAPTSPRLARISAPDPFDLAENMQQMDLSPFLARTANRQITMVEEPFTAGLDYEGLPLPILTEDELLNENWNLEEPEGAAVVVQGELEFPGEEVRKRGRADEMEEGAAKKARVEEGVPVEETVMEAPGEAAAVDAPGRARSAPEIQVTPSVADLARSRISPPQIQVDVDQVLDLPQEEHAEVVEVPVVEVPVVEVPVVEVPAQEVEVAHVPVQEAELPQDDDAFLQPLIPAAAPRPRAGRKGGKKLVDATTQLRHQDIREMMETGWRRTLRCEHPSQDLVMVEQLKTVKAGQELGEELGDWFQEELRREQRTRVWDWEQREVVEQLGEGAEVVEQLGEVAEVVEQLGEGAEVVQQLADMELGPGEGLLPQEGEVTVEGEREGEVGRDLSRNVSTNLQGVMGESLGRNTTAQTDVNIAVAANNVSALAAPEGGLDVPEGAINMDTTPVLGGDVLEASNMVVEIAEHPEAVDLEQQPEPLVDEEQQQEIPADLAPVTVTEGEVTAALQELWTEGGGSCFFQDLCPLPTTVRGAAALSFYRVLKMEKRGRLATEQEETYGPIGIRDTESQLLQ